MISQALEDRLRKIHENVVRLDGDIFRGLMGNDLGHNPEDRLENAWRIARLSKFLSGEGIEVITATISMYEDVRKWLRVYA